ncbi:hypothetical protein ACYULU_06525 [Breznakiellaceae bacterium SP9]
MAAEEIKAENPNEFEFSKAKGFSYINYSIKTSRVVLEENGVTVNRSSKWFYFIKGKNKSATVDYKSIDKVESKVHFSFWDLLFGLAFLVFLVLSLDKTWLVLALIWLFCAFGKNIVIRLKNGSNIVIMSEGIGQQKKIDRFMELLNERLESVSTESASENSGNNVALEQTVNELSDEDFISKLPFKKILEKNKSIPQKILPYINRIAVGIVVLLLVFVLHGIFGGISTESLEKQVLESVQKQFTATELQLIKVSDNLYTGIVKGKNTFGMPVQKTITVVCDGRNFQWEFQNY